MKELVYHRLFLPAVEQNAQRVAVRDAGYEATFEQHCDRVLRLADGLGRQLGVGRGDRVAVLAANGHRYLELYHAAFLGACVVNPLNLRLNPTELAYILKDSGTEVVLVDQAFSWSLEQAKKEGGFELRHTVLVGDGDVPHDVSYEELVASGEATTPEEPDESDPAVLMYTGGTTGLPKGVLCSHRAEMLNLYHVVMTVGISRHEVYLHQTPMFHAASMGGVLGVPAEGAASVVVPFFEPGAVLDAIEARGVTFTVMVPTMIAMLLQHERFAPERVATLERLVYGASPMPPALLQRIFDVMPHVALYQGYGMTEASAILTMLGPEDHAAGGEVLASAGRPVPGCVLSIQDADGRALAAGEVGEVCARAGNFMDSYWQNEEATAEVFRGGWYHTGDMGSVDANGYLYLVDRVKDMIVTGGENVYSVEVENAITSHPKVLQVAVIGVPDDVWGEAVHAIVVPKPGETLTSDEVAAWARKTIAGYKVPKSVEVREEPIPLSGAMKPLKRELRKKYWEGHERGIH